MWRAAVLLLARAEVPHTIKEKLPNGCTNWPYIVDMRLGYEYDHHFSYNHPEASAIMTVQNMHWGTIGGTIMALALALTLTLAF
jgi:hypothetical protein